MQQIVHTSWCLNGFQFLPIFIQNALFSFETQDIFEIEFAQLCCQVPPGWPCVFPGSPGFSFLVPGGLFSLGAPGFSFRCLGVGFPCFGGCWCPWAPLGVPGGTSLAPAVRVFTMFSAHKLALFRLVSPFFLFFSLRSFLLCLRLLSCSLALLCLSLCLSSLLSFLFFLSSFVFSFLSSFFLLFILLGFHWVMNGVGLSTAWACS